MRDPIPRYILLLLLPFTSLFFFTACSDKFTCPTPGGVSCLPVTAAYERVLKHKDIRISETSQENKEEFQDSTEPYINLDGMDTSEYIIRTILVNRWVDKNNVVYGKSYITLAIPQGVREAANSKLRLLSPRWRSGAEGLLKEKATKTKQNSRKPSPYPKPGTQLLPPNLFTPPGT